MREASMPEAKKYRKIGLILARQLEPGETLHIQTLEGPATGCGPTDWHAQAYTERGEQWFIPDGYFTGPDGYVPTGEIAQATAVYRKKRPAEVMAVQADGNGQPVQMPTMHEPVVAPAGHWVVQTLDGGAVRVVDPQVFAETYEPVT